MKAKVFENRGLSWKAKVQVYNAMVVPMMTYGCESWVLREKENPGYRQQKWAFWGRLQEWLEWIIVEMRRSGTGFEESDIGEWRQADADDKGYAHLGDAEIILQVIDDVTETVDEPEVEPSCPLIPHGHAVKMLDSCIALATAARWS